MNYEEILIDILGKEIEKIPKDIYDNVINYLISDNKEYLIIISEKMDNNKIQAAEKVIRLSASSFLNQPIDMIKSKVLPDERYVDFKEIYNHIFELSLKKANGEDIVKLTPEEAKMIIEKMEEYLSDIKDYNRKTAEYYYNEFLVNIDQLCDLPVTSIGIHDQSK